MGRRQYFNKWERYSDTYTKQSYKEFKRVFLSWGKGMSEEELAKETYRSYLSAYLEINTDQMDEAYKKVYTSVGLKHGKRVGASINAQLKMFTFNAFESLFVRNIIDFFNTYGVERIQLVKSTYFADIVKLMESRIEQGLTTVEAAREVHKIIGSNRFYRWQALRIARTESTAAANFSATQAGEVSGFVMEKEWISATDSRTRRKPPNEFDHIHMNGKRVGLDEKFTLRSSKGKVDKMEYPGDPSGSAADVVNCRCTVAVVPKRDKDGKLVRTDGEFTQPPINVSKPQDIRNRNILDYEKTIRNNKFETSFLFPFLVKITLPSSSKTLAVSNLLFLIVFS